MHYLYLYLVRVLIRNIISFLNTFRLRPLRRQSLPPQTRPLPLRNLFMESVNEVSASRISLFSYLSRIARSSLASVISPSSMPSPTNQCTKARRLYIWKTALKGFAKIASCYQIKLVVEPRPSLLHGRRV